MPLYTQNVEIFDHKGLFLPSLVKIQPVVFRRCPLIIGDARQRTDILFLFILHGKCLPVCFVWFVALRSSQQLWSC